VFAVFVSGSGVDGFYSILARVGFTFGAQNGDDRPGTENGTAENGKRQASGPRKHHLRTAARIYLKEKRDTS
jgi:hypothetical protein